MYNQSCAAMISNQDILRQLKRAATRSESITWLAPNHSYPIWSRRLSCNLEGSQRHTKDTRWRNYDVEVKERLWSLWGGLHPRAPMFDSTMRGHQTLACCVIACCAASTFRNLGDWSGKLLDSIVLNGDRYYRVSVEQSHRWGQPLQVDDMCVQCEFQDLNFYMQMDLVAFGQVYSAPVSAVMGLLEGLNFFFSRYQWGVLECQGRHFAFGYSSSREGGYFLYDCSAWGKPLFPENSGASYILRTTRLQMLLYCIVITLNLRRKNVDFRLFNVDMARIPNSPKNDQNCVTQYKSL